MVENLLGKFKICSMSNFVICLFINFVYILNQCAAFTHWVVTENGRIQFEESSIFQMRSPENLIDFLEQENRANDFLQLFAELKRRKRDLNSKWSQLSAESELERNINFINSDCYQIQDIDFYEDTIEYSLPYLKKEDYEDSSDHGDLDCTSFSDLDFSMATFPHLQVLSQPWNLTWAKETDIEIPLSPRQIYNGLNKNKTSWLLYNLASLHWRKAGNSQRAIDCIKRSVHFASREHKYMPLFNLGVMLQKAQCIAEAALLLHCSIDHEPLNAKGYFALAFVYLKLGDYERSLDCYDNALRINPNWTMAKKAKQFILCHNNLKQRLSQLQLSLHEVTTEVSELTGIQERLIKVQQDIYKNQESHFKTITQLLALGERCNFKSPNGDVICKPLKQYNIFQPVDTDTLSLQILLSRIQTLSSKISVDSLFLPLVTLDDKEKER